MPHARIGAIMTIALSLVVSHAAGAGFGRRGTIKVRVRTPEKAAQLIGKGAELVAQYEGFAVLELPAVALEPDDQVEELAQENVVLLSSGPLDTRDSAVRQLQRPRRGLWWKGTSPGAVRRAGEAPVARGVDPNRRPRRQLHSERHLPGLWKRGTVGRRAGAFIAAPRPVGCRLPGRTQNPPARRAARTAKLPWPRTGISTPFRWWTTRLPTRRACRC